MRAFLSLSHFIIVAKETSSQDLIFNMSAFAGPHIHLAETSPGARPEQTKAGPEDGSTAGPCPLLGRGT